MTTTPRLLSLDGTLAATAMQCVLTQHANGSWVSPPSSQIPETALACFALSPVGDTGRSPQSPVPGPGSSITPRPETASLIR